MKNKKQTTGPRDEWELMVVVWLSGNIVGRINEVALRRAGLVLRWVTVHVYTLHSLGI